MRVSAKQAIQRETFRCAKKGRHGSMRGFLGINRLRRVSSSLQGREVGSCRGGNRVSSAIPQSVSPCGLSRAPGKPFGGHIALPPERGDPRTHRKAIAPLNAVNHRLLNSECCNRHAYGVTTRCQPKGIHRTKGGKQYFQTRLIRVQSPSLLGFQRSVSLETIQGV